jgi:hypothetical protein
VQSLTAVAGPGSISGLVRQAGASLVLGAVLPWAGYQVLTARGVDSIPALAITANFPVIGTVYGWVRLGRPDVIGTLGVLFIGASIALGMATGSELVILARRSVNNVIFAVLCFGSLAYGRPLMFHLARQYLGGANRTTYDTFAERWELPAFRRAMRRITFGWGVWLLIQAVVRVIAAEYLEVSTFLIVSPTFTAVGSFAMLGWSLREAQQSVGRGAVDPAKSDSGLGAAARGALDRAAAEAKRLHHGSVGTEHLLVALCDDPSPAAEALRRVSVTPVTARTTLETLLGPGTTPDWQELTYADHLRSALKRADGAHRATSASEIEPRHLLIGLLDEPICMAVEMLTYSGVDVAALRARLVASHDEATEIASR